MPTAFLTFRALVLACGLSTAAIDFASAQGFDLRSLLPGVGPRERAELQRREREEQEKRSCDRLKGWLEEAPLGIDPGRQTGADQQAAAMKLLEDGRFKRAFGKTYDQMTPEELKTASDSLPRCLDPRGPLGSYNPQRGVLYTALQPQRQAANVKQINAARSASSSLQAMTEELPGLQPNEQGYARLTAIHESGDSLATTADRNSSGAYASALAAADARVAVPVQTAMVRDAIANAQGYGGMLQLTRVASDLQKHGPAGAAMRENQLQLNVRMEQLASELVAFERQRIDVLGNGMVGLERGVQWQAEFDARYKPWTTQVRTLNDMQSYFNTRRAAMLGSASGEFASMARRAASDEQLRVLQRRYLLPADSGTVAGTQMLSTVADQRYELEKRSALGTSLDQERRETQASVGANNGGGGSARAGGDTAPGRSAAAKANNGSSSGNANGNASGNGTNNTASPGNVNGEPTQEVMYDLVRSRYEREAERIRNLAKRCSSSRMSDPGDAIVCLSISMAGGMGADEPPKITRFEKLGCALASGKPGYYCEFVHSVSGGPTKFMGPITQSLAGDGGVSNARFIKRSGDWIMITTQER